MARRADRPHAGNARFFRLRRRATLQKHSKRRPTAYDEHGVVGGSGRTIRFSGGEDLQPDAVVWATGFRVDHSWIEVPVFDEGGRVVHERGVTESPGLYFLGMPWQHTRGSALIGWIKDDAEYLAQKIGELEPAAGADAAVPAGADAAVPAAGGSTTGD